ncbi:STAS domain-containing protein [Pseudonocardia endophytica]|uniref:Anti-anti-sigma regulatory factor n=1 Tax=Pseudonocardia endophytica TaxID=401976 RepID=A0A4R1HW40_PSEEN|nr:STAS domain-containing protein [Pseudonocardia endophytica]TCK21742.1 anti-anti-sigma regulatory factor [Pseudonocardia endophytica]
MLGRQVQVTVERPHERVVLIRANGVLDRGAAAALLRLIDAQAELVRHGRRSLAAVLVDVDGVTTFDAVAFRDLAHARDRARRGGFALCLTGCGGRRALLPLAVQQALTEHRTFPTAEAAIAAHTPRPVAVDFPEPRTPVEQRTAVPV